MNIKVNGKDHQFDEPLNINQLLTAMKIKNSMIVVELNLNIIIKENYDKTFIKNDDVIEIVGFAGGG